MFVVPVKELLEAGVHFGTRASRWNPKMHPFIFGKRNLIHIIDLRQTLRGLLRATAFLQRLAAEGHQVLFVGTKRQAQTVIVDAAREVNMPFVSERWLGGTLTNFQTIRSRLQRLTELEGMEKDGSITDFSKKYISSLNRERRKIFRNLDGLRTMDKLPGALIVVDPRKEHNAVKEANKLGIPVIAILDTDCDPEPVDIPIPGNDDSMRSIQVLTKKLTEAIASGNTAYAQWLQEEEKRRVEEDAKRAEEQAKLDEAQRRRAEEREKLKAAQERLRQERESAPATPAAVADPAAKTEDPNTPSQ
ncbi:MAG TPA: 30S ribosomal protein S2 [Planctomycetota bacterium]|jgi:small subunit ribosomal protein S2|nr:30S ribosomal protein S2 [Planctomycetota bacterium]